MNLIDIFESPFKLVSSRRYTNPTPELKVKFKTENIYVTTTKEEIFILSKMHLDNIITRYKNYTIEDAPTSESTYKLYVGVIVGDELEFKHIYSVFYNNRTNTIAWENKYNDNASIEGNFFIGLDVSTYVIIDFDSEEEEEDKYKIQQPITEEECIVCYENKPNILYTECLHYVVCNYCDKKGKFSKCPFCRKKINNRRILFS